MFITLLKEKLWQAPRTNRWIVSETVLMLSASLLIAYFLPAPFMLPVFSILSFMWAVDSAWHAHFLCQRGPVIENINHRPCDRAKGQRHAVSEPNSSPRTISAGGASASKLTRVRASL